MKKIKSIFFTILFILTFAIGNSYVLGNDDTRTVSIKLSSYFDNSHQSETVISGLKYGTTVSVSDKVEIPENYEFSMWLLNGTVKKYPLNHSFMITDNTILDAVFKPAGKNAAVFMDSNGLMIDIQYVNPGMFASVDGLTLPSKPGYTPIGWDKPVDNTPITEDTVFLLGYEKNATTEYTVNVINGYIDGTKEVTRDYAFNEVVTVSTPLYKEGLKFSHWQIDNRIVSNQTTYSFTILNDVNIYAVYTKSGSLNEPLVTTSKNLSGLVEGKNTYLGQFYLPEDYTLIEYGFIHKNTSGIEVKKQAFALFDQTKEWMMSFPVAEGETVRAYLVYQDGDAFKTIYDNTTSDGMVLDGIVNEVEYLNIKEYLGGIGGSVLYRFAATDEGLYIGAIVNDNNLIKGSDSLTDKTAKLNHSDSLEFSFNPMNINSTLIKGSDCFRIRIGIDGTYQKYVSNNNNDQWSIDNTDLSNKFAINTGTGTISTNKETKMNDPLASDIDGGYSVELFLTWEEIGYTGRPNSPESNYTEDFIKINLGHRDVTNPEIRSDFRQTNAQDSWISANNIFFNDNNIHGRPLVATQALHPEIYNSLYINGNYEMTGINPSIFSQDVVLDGYMEEDFWSNAKEIPMQNTSQGALVNARIKMDELGVYVGVYVKDTNIVAEARSFLNNYGINSNDCIDVRLVPASEFNSTSMFKPVDVPRTNGKITLFDPVGAAYMGMLQPVGIDRVHMKLPFKYGVAVDGTIGHSRYDNLWSSANQFLADTNIDDTDTGWGIEYFVPWSTLNLAKPESGVEVEIAIFITILDRNADLTNSSWSVGYVNDESETLSIAPNPSTYYRYKEVIEYVK